MEKESSDYNAASLKLREKQIIFRSAKITPKKNGLFVTLWRRNKNGITIPFHERDQFDIVIIEVRNLRRIGHFVFRKDILIKNGIISSKKVGKRGFRIYPPWEIPSSKQAAVSQNWQLEHFFEEKKENVDDSLNLERIINFDSSK
ncbi:MepB family protein [Leptospira licerasiae]|uniref:MepB family protein n=1 Tax=Leptospira licerasiae TaxID=447106 RepID=UPI001FCC4C8B|nr:MepB family protein [Leptospira licerasiae]